MTRTGCSMRRCHNDGLDDGFGGSNWALLINMPVEHP
jgi:hypothetical protein